MKYYIINVKTRKPLAGKYNIVNKLPNGIAPNDIITFELPNDEFVRFRVKYRELVIMEDGEMYWNLFVRELSQHEYDFLRG